MNTIGLLVNLAILIVSIIAVYRKCWIDNILVCEQLNVNFNDINIKNYYHFMVTL